MTWSAEWTTIAHFANHVGQPSGTDPFSDAVNAWAKGQRRRSYRKAPAAPQSRKPQAPEALRSNRALLMAGYFGEGAAASLTEAAAASLDASVVAPGPTQVGA